MSQYMLKYLLLYFHSRAKLWLYTDVSKYALEELLLKTLMMSNLRPCLDHVYETVMGVLP